MTALETRMGYTFKDQSILVRALTHSSYGDGRRKVLDYEQLEFLGDRVLGLLTADMLYRKEAEDEGGMARKLNALVRKETCAKVSKALKLGDALLMSPSEAKQGGREKISILGDACEALIAAIYIDGGIEAVSKFYYENWKEDIEHVLKASMKDPKTMLQEKSASIGAGSPEYSVLDRSGPDHKPIFVVNVNVEKIGKATGTGTSKKDAERVAASQLLENWPL
ncbi:MAG: ribonuclease III [Maricaulaceae bacterium]